MYVYACSVFTEEEMIKRMLLIQICFSYLILSSRSLYILHTTVGNSSPITIYDIFICSVHDDVCDKTYIVFLFNSLS